MNLRHAGLTALAALGTLAAVAVPSAATSLTPGATGTPGTIAIHPAALPRGANPAVPVQVGHTIVDGDTRLRVRTGDFNLLGPSGRSYVVVGWTGDGPARLLRITPDGTRDGRTTVLRRVGQDREARLSSDGRTAVLTHYLRGSRARVLVVDARDGHMVASRDLRGYATVLDARRTRLVLTTSAPARTLWWDFARDTTRRIVGRNAGAADIRADRLATYTADPYQGGCLVVTSLSHPAQRLWRSCAEGVIGFSPDGARMATANILADGLGPGEVTVRRIHGAMLARYSAYYFPSVRWESRRALLLDTVTRRSQALVRCVVDRCERASAVRPSPDL